MAKASIQEYRSRYGLYQDFFRFNSDQPSLNA
jgi:hypothetical protein